MFTKGAWGRSEGGNEKVKVSKNPRAIKGGSPRPRFPGTQPAPFKVPTLERLTTLRRKFSALKKGLNPIRLSMIMDWPGESGEKPSSPCRVGRLWHSKNGTT